MYISKLKLCLREAMYGCPNQAVRAASHFSNLDKYGSKSLVA